MNVPDAFFNLHPGARRLGNNPGSLISNLLPNILVIAGLVLLILIVYSGYNLMSDAGSGNQQAMAKHKAALTYGVLGFLIVVSAYFILQIVGVSTGVDFTNLGGINLF